MQSLLLPSRKSPVTPELDYLIALSTLTYVHPYILRMGSSNLITTPAPDSVLPMCARCALQDSPHFKNEARKFAATEQKIVRMKHQAAQLSSAELATREKCALSQKYLWFGNCTSPPAAI